MYANIIIDISHEKVDRTFQYRIPKPLEGQIRAGVQVRVPFGAGNRLRTGYVVEVTDRTEWAPEQIKDVAGVVTGSVTAESQLIQLAWWMKEYYGSTMNQALKTVLPVKQSVRRREDRVLVCRLSREELREAAEEAGRKKYRARERLLRAFLDNPRIPYGVAVRQMHLAAGVIKPLLEKGVLALESQQIWRDPVLSMEKLGNGGDGAGGPETGAPLTLNPEQRAVAADFCRRYDAGDRQTCLLYGVTGSGKTEVYMELIRHVLAQGRQAIVLIPEIALTYQTVLRFYRNFGSRVAVVNSRLSAGERYDQFERARSGEAGVMIGPRSALFTPFSNLGLIILDEEHETAYKSELSPRYHARETAQKLAELTGAALVLGSATPSLEAYSRAMAGRYRLYRLTKRARPGSRMARVTVADLRKELREGNKSIFSRALQEAMEEQLGQGNQVMLFLNRRGYANFMSCRSCGQALKCPHCDVTLTLHKNGSLVCHYCGYQARPPKKCPSCGSPYIAGFGAGTQKIEELVRNMFPASRVLRMDLDTTSKKGGHEEILAAFADGEADILVGTQMIVKGHDFPRVTLVGVLAADLSLYSADFRCGERTFQLLTQAAGRAGRDEAAGQVIIQTYSPEHYSIVCAASQDYEAFYRQEMAYRQVLHYPPACGLLSVLVSSREEAVLNEAVNALYGWVAGLERAGRIELIGPAEAPVYKVNDIYRKNLYLKQEKYDILIKIKDELEARSGQASWFSHVMMQYDLA